MIIQSSAGRATPIDRSDSGAGGANTTDYALPNDGVVEKLLIAFLMLCLIVNIACYWAELQFRPQLEKKRPWVLRLPIYVWMILLFIEILRATLIQASQHCERERPENLSMNADIGGIGTRVGTYIAEIITIILAGLGHFHAEWAGAKEFGAAHLLCMYTSLTILSRPF